CTSSSPRTSIRRPRRARRRTCAWNRCRSRTRTAGSPRGRFETPSRSSASPRPGNASKADRKPIEAWSRTKVSVEQHHGKAGGVSRDVRRVLVIVLDSCGVGELPDAAEFGDAGSSTLPHTAAACGGLRLPAMGRLGLGRIAPVEGVPPAPAPAGAFGKMAETSRGKDSTTGHWELMGLVLDRPFPTYPRGFPPEVIGPFEARIGRRVLGNRPASGTEIIKDLGEEHLRTGRPIVYTSADSVFQIAAHEGRIPAGLIFTNLVDLDTLFGHRNNPRGYGDDLEQIDREMAKVVAGLGPEDLLIITADHGNDPTTSSTDHSREYVPLLVAGLRVRGGRDLGTRRTFADVGATVAEAMGVPLPEVGTSVLREVWAE